MGEQQPCLSREGKSGLRWEESCSKLSSIHTTSADSEVLQGDFYKQPKEATRVFLLSPEGWPRGAVEAAGGLPLCGQPGVPTLLSSR